MANTQSNKLRILQAYLIVTLVLLVFAVYQTFSSFVKQPNLNFMIASFFRSIPIPGLVILGVCLIGIVLLVGTILTLRRGGNTSRSILRMVDGAVGNNLVSVLLSIVFLLLLLSTFAILESPPHIFDRAIPKNTAVIQYRVYPSMVALGIFSLLSLILLVFWDHSNSRESMRKRSSDLMHRWVPLLILIFASVKLGLYIVDRVIIGAPPDVGTYLRIANEMTHPFDTGIIEPVWIWVVKATTILPGNGELPLFVLTSLLFLGSLAIIYRLVLDLFNNRPMATITAVLLLSFDNLFEAAALGVRDNLSLISVLALIYVCFVDADWLDTKRRVVLSTIFFTIAIGTRFTNLYPLLLILLVSYWKKQIKLRSIWIPIAIGSIVMGPYLYSSYMNYGDAMISSNIHARWIRNYEFIALKQTGCAGCPTAEEYNPLLHQGEPISTFEYIFGLHSLEEVITNTFLGFLAVYLSPSNYFSYLTGESHAIIFLFYLTGLAVFLFKEDKFFLIIPLMLTNFLLFTVPFYMPPRYLIINSVYFAILIAYGIDFLAGKSNELDPRVGELITGKAG